MDTSMSLDGSIAGPNPTLERPLGDGGERLHEWRVRGRARGRVPVRHPSHVQRQEDRRSTMGKLVVTEFITLDGVIEDPGGGETFERGGWAFRFDRGEEGDKFKLDELMTSEAQLLGRKTYEGFAKAWPAMDGTGEFGEKMNAMPKFVGPTTLDDA